MRLFIPYFVAPLARILITQFGNSGARLAPRLVWNENPLFLLRCLIALSAGVSGAYARQPNQSAVMDTTSGKVTIQVEGDNNKQALHLVITDEKGNRLSDIGFKTLEDPTYEHEDLRFEIIHINGIDFPLIAVVAGYAGGSDSQFESTLVSVVGAKTQELVPHLETNIEGAVCPGNFGTDSKPGVLRVNFKWGDEGHYQPHLYEYWFYSWDGKQFVLSKHGQTKKEYGEVKKAISELGYTCKRDIVYDLMSEMY